MGKVQAGQGGTGIGVQGGRRPERDAVGDAGWVRGCRGEMKNELRAHRDIWECRGHAGDARMRDGDAEEDARARGQWGG